MEFKKNPLQLELVFNDETLDNFENIPNNTSRKNFIIVKYNKSKNDKDEEIWNTETWLLKFDTYFNDVCDHLRYRLIQIQSNDETGGGVLVSKDGKFVTSLHIIIGRGKNKIAIEKARPIVIWKKKRYHMEILNVLEDYDLILCKLKNIDEETSYV